MKGLLTAELTDFHKTKCYLYLRRWLSWMILISVNILVGWHCCHTDVHHQIYSNNKKLSWTNRKEKKILCFRKDKVQSFDSIPLWPHKAKTEWKNMFFVRETVKRERGNINFFFFLSFLFCHFLFFYYYCQINAFFKKKKKTFS